jgi:F-type H+-transporting ATPase subunit b
MDIGKRFVCKRLVFVFLWLMLSGGLVFASSGGNGEHGGKAVKGWCATDTYRVMNFVVLIGALVFLLRKPVANGLRERIDGIRHQLSDLEDKKADAERQMQESNNRLKGLEKESEQIVDEYIKQGEVAKIKILEDAQKMGGKIQEQALKAMDTEYNLARRILFEELFEKATVLAKDVIEQNIKSDDHERLVGEYIEKVVV